jgi:nucleolar protein 58
LYRLKLKQFVKYENAATALNEAAAITEGKVTPMLSSLLDTLKDEKKVSLAVADPKLGNAINKLPGLSLSPVSDSSTTDLYRGIRTHLSSLIPGLLPADVNTMSLGLSHSLSRHKVKFSPDKVDTMIIHAIGLLDDLDKELNTYAMRTKEWYGWHFPEMAKIINDNLAYARVILEMGMRTSAHSADLSGILPEEIETAVKAAAEVSMGTEITGEDLENIRALAEQVVDFTLYRQQLSSYLSARMQAIAPNLTALVGELVGARLIAHAGSLTNLAKSAGSTIQILGAEKALFRALKTKHDTPKYGLIYHASLIGQATGRNKGKVARMLANRAALSLRVDSQADLGVGREGSGDAAEPTDEERAAYGTAARVGIERRLRVLEGKPLRATGTGVGPVGAGPGKWEVKEARKYNPDADGLAGNEPAAAAKTNGTLNGDVKMIEEVDSGDESDSESDDEAGAGAEQATPKAAKQADGDLSKSERKALKAAEKEAKRARKAARAAKREAKSAKKEAKKRKAKAALEPAEGKKRKRDDEGEKGEKKKKKKSRD